MNNSTPGQVATKISFWTANDGLTVLISGYFDYPIITLKSCGCMRHQNVEPSLDPQPDL